MEPALIVSDVKSWVHGIYILLIQLLPEELNCLTEAYTYK